MMKNPNPSHIVYIIALSVSLIFLSCNKHEQRESPTNGTLTLISSEDIYPIMDLQVSDFTRIYDKTKIIHLSSTTRDAIVQLLNDSVKLIVSSRDLNDEEKSVIRKNELEVIPTKIAYDAVAVITNEKNLLKRISTAQLQSILLGNIKKWSEVKEAKMNGSIFVAMGDANSGVYEFIKHRITQDQKFAPIVYPCSTTSQVIKIIQDRPNGIGFVGISWLREMPKGICVLEIGDPNFKSDNASTSKELEYFAPHQAHVYRNFYPLSRTLYLFGHKMGKGVALGFTSFVAGVEGQKIFVKNGLVPATMPVRLVQLTQQ